MNKRVISAAMALALGTSSLVAFTAPTFAQDADEPTVTVILEEGVRTELTAEATARGIIVPETVVVPLSEAAIICEIEIEELRRSIEADANFTCTVASVEPDVIVIILDSLSEPVDGEDDDDDEPDDASPA